MQEKKYIISGVKKEELLSGLTNAGAELIGEREYSMTYLKNAQNEEDLKAVLHYENKFLDFDPDFPEDPKVRVMVGDPRSRSSFVDSADNFKTEVKKLEGQGYEEFSCSVSTDYDVAMPKSLTPYGSYEIFGISDYTLGDPDDRENYPYSLYAVMLTEHVIVDKVLAKGKEIETASADRIKKLLSSVLKQPIAVAEVESEVVTALDLIDLEIKESDEAVSGEDE